MDLFAKVSSALGFGDPRNSEELTIARNIVLERLKKCIQKIVQDSRDTDGEHLDETNESVHELVWMLETCLFQGIIPLKGNDDTDNVYSLNYSKKFTCLRTLNIKETGIFLFHYLYRIFFL